MKIAIVTTGDEIMAGNIVDSNAVWISDRCWMLGHKVVLHIGVGDDRRDIGEALMSAGKKAGCVIVSGGLGATVDDITLEAASEAFGLRMVFHEDVWKGIEAFFKKVNRACSENNQRQAYLPEGAKVLPNRVGTAPGVHLAHKGRDYFFVPGVPKEMMQIFEDSIWPWLKENSEAPGYHQRFLRLFGLPEATFDQMIKGLSFEGINLSFRVSFPEVRIKLVARSKKGAEAKRLVDDAAGKIREALGDYIFGEDEETLEGVVGKLLKSKGYRLAIAESCTGGLIADMITDVPGSSGYFERGYVTYSNRAKVEDLGVPADVIEKHGAVSPEIVCAMAEGAKNKGGADYAVAVTGIAGPAGGTRDKPVGTVHIAVAGPEGVVQQHYLYPRDREGFKKIVAATALDMLRRCLGR